MRNLFTIFLAKKINQLLKKEIYLRTVDGLVEIKGGNIV